MHGVGRWLVYSRPRAWIGTRIEVPGLLRGVSIPGGARCLDIAMGLGWAGVGLLREDPSVRIVGLDYDGTILPRTREYLESQGADRNVSLSRGDGKHLPFRDASFDLVICLYGLHHFRGYREGMGEIERVLKPSGTMALIDPVRGAGKPPGGHHGTEVLTREELERMVAETGFELMRSRVSLGTVKAVARKKSGGQRNAGR